MLIVIGKVAYLFIWVFLGLNLVMPYPHPANILCNIALCAMVLLHGLQALLFSTSRTHIEKKCDRWAVVRFFFFGVFEVLSWKKKSAKKNNELK